MKFITAQDAATLWGISAQMVRRYCRESKIEGAIETTQGWMIPERTPKPGTQITKEFIQTPLVKQILYQHARNNHFGIYEYIQTNLAYSSNRMASNRLTRQQVMEIYRTKKVSSSSEPLKVDDIVEISNHFICMRFVISNIAMPLTVSFIKQIHSLLTYGTYAEQVHKTGVGEFRTTLAKLGIPPAQINKALYDLVKSYERSNPNLEQLLDFHVKFERIHPFADYNGRMGRILMMKECLRYGVTPFIIDDKQRSKYFRGISLWEYNPAVLTDIVLHDQQRFQNQMDTCQMMQYSRTANSLKRR